jgi:mRNA-degrading endonuclease toxin of MazEF toxin-antitoxin module
MVGDHPVVIVSRPSRRANVLAAYITSVAQPQSEDTIPLSTMECTHVHGYIRCDKLFWLEKADEKQNGWIRYVCTLSESDMKLVEAGLRYALEL